MGKTRDNRDFKVGDVCHIYNRGNERKNIAKEEEDLSFYEALMFQLFVNFNQELLAYCIMPNHYHFQVQITEPKHFVKLMHSFGMKSAAYYNKKYNTVGHLFQDKYKHRKMTSNADMLYVSRYIHRNPYKGDGLGIKEITGYQWSSFNCYLENEMNKDTDYRIKMWLLTDHFRNNEEYCRYVLGNQDVFLNDTTFSKIYEKCLEDLLKKEYMTIFKR